MNINIWTARIFVAFKIIGFFNTCMLQIFALIYISYMCIYVILIFFNKTTQIQTPHPMVGSGYRLSNFWMAKGVNKEVKKKLYISTYKNHIIL
jgi:hypothetical protein